MLLHLGLDEGPVDVVASVVELLVGDVGSFLEEGNAA